MSRRPWRWLPLLLAVAGCSSPTEQAVDELRDQQQRWEALGLERYAFDFRRICFCGGALTPMRVTVRDGAVASVIDPATGQPPRSVELAFDDTYHFPTHARVDRIENAIDDEYEVTLAQLAPLP